MDPLELSYENAESIPSGFADLYTEKDGAFVLTGIKGMKTQGDIDRLSGALTKERGEHGEAKTKLKALTDWLGDRTPEEIQTSLDEIEELRVRAESGGGEFPQDKLEELVAQRVGRERAPIERKLAAAETTIGELQTQLAAATGELTTRDLHGHLREVGEKMKLRPEAMEDWLSFGERIFERQDDGTWASKDQVGVTPNVTADIVLGDLKDRRPHWWPDSVGGGASGGKGGTGVAGADNPWSAAGWNLTKQGQIQRDNPQRAEMMRKAAGAVIGQTKPTQPAKTA